MGIQTEVWRQDIVENLFPSNQFSNYATNHDMHVLEGALVHIARAGAKPTVVKNRTQLPAAVGTRTDTDLQYALSEYSTNPVYLKNTQKYELSYDMRMSIMGEHIAALRETIHDELLLAWVGEAEGLGELPTQNLLQSTGTNVGGKNRIVLDDLLRIKQRMDKANVPDEGRCLLLPPELYGDLFNIPEMLNIEAMGRTTLPKGVVAQVLGFNIVQRSYTPVYDDELAIKPRNANVAGTDRLSAVAWSRYSVSRALGEVQLYERVDDPTYYGDIYSASVRAGGIRLRNEGVYVLVQGND
jgi:hypothetical protein